MNCRVFEGFTQPLPNNCWERLKLTPMTLSSGTNRYRKLTNLYNNRYGSHVYIVIAKKYKWRTMKDVGTIWNEVDQFELGHHNKGFFRWIRRGNIFKVTRTGQVGPIKQALPQDDQRVYLMFSAP